MNEVINCLLSRRSIRRYRPEPVLREDLLAIVACGHNAPTGCNCRPWRFVAVDEKPMLERIAGMCRYGGFIADAGACVAVFLADRAATPIEDCSAAMMNMITAAASLGYGTCWVHSREQSHSFPVTEAMGVPPQWKLMALLSIGVPDEKPVIRIKDLEKVLTLNPGH